MMEYQAMLQLSRDSSDNFNLRIRDQNSAIQLAEFKLSAEQFADLLTNRMVETSVEWGNLSNVGKKRITEQDQLSIPMYTSDLLVLEKAIADKHKDDKEWTPNYYLGSRGQIHHLMGCTIVRYSKYKFI